MDLDELGPIPFLVYPTPATTTLNIQAPTIGEDGAIIQIRDASGRLVQTSTISSRATVDVSGLARGTYLVKIISEGEHSFFQRVLLQ